MTTTQSVNNRGQLRTDPIRNFRFIARFTPYGTSDGNGWSPNKVSIGFSSISGLNQSTESIPYREGQHNTTVHQIPGQTTFSPITFQRGVVLGSSQHWDWAKMLFRVNDPNGKQINFKNSFRAQIDVDVLLHPVPYSTTKQSYGEGVAVGPNGAASDDVVAMKFTVYNAWPTSVAYSDLNAGDNALLVEQLTVTHEGFEVDWVTGKDGPK